MLSPERKRLSEAPTTYCQERGAWDNSTLTSTQDERTGLFPLWQFTPTRAIKQDKKNFEITEGMSLKQTITVISAYKRNPKYFIQVQFQSLSTRLSSVFRLAFQQPVFLYSCLPVSDHLTCLLDLGFPCLSLIGFVHLLD